MPYIRLIDEAEADGLLKEEYDAAVERAGKVFNILGCFNYVTRVADGVGIEDEPEWRSD